MNPVCLGIPPDKNVYKASWMFGVLPLVAKRACIILADVGYKLMYRSEALIEGFWSNLVTGKLVNLVWVALDARHVSLLRLVATRPNAPRCKPPRRRSILNARLARDLQITLSKITL